MPRGPIYTTKLTKSGNSWVLSIERDLREALGLVPGDIIVMRLHAPYVTLRRAVPEREIPLTDLNPACFPPSWPGKDNTSGSSHTQARTATGTVTPDSRTDGRGKARESRG